MAKVKGLLEDLEQTPEYQAGWQAYHERKDKPAMSIEELRRWHRGFEAARDQDLSP